MPSVYIATAYVELAQTILQHLVSGNPVGVHELLEKQY